MFSALWLICASTILTACAAAGTEAQPGERPNPTPVTDLDEVAGYLADMRELWESQAQREYEFEFRWNCFCPPGYREWARVFVEDGEIVSVEPVSAEAEQGLPPQSEYRTISGLYNLLRDAVQQQAHQIDLEFDEAQGLPTFAYIDYDALIVDEERGFEIRRYTTR
jgi:hypothetical protein